MSLTAFRAFGIPVRLHWSMLFLLIFVAMSKDAVGSAVLLSIVFVSLTIHEFGHALTAKYLGFRTDQILLTPIGGLACLDDSSRDLFDSPRDEFLITIMGPATNVAILALATAYLLITNPAEGSGTEWFMNLVGWVNFALFAFNAIPIWPMDGGRIMRSTLRLVLNKRTTLKVTYYVSTAFIIAMLAAGVYMFSISLILIGLFMFLVLRRETYG